MKLLKALLDAAKIKLLILVEKGKQQLIILRVKLLGK